VAAHNAVNERLNKPVFSAEAAATVHGFALGAA
jgi:hypothetical protein